MSSYWRRFVKRFHPEGIPWPGNVLYRALSTSNIFQRHYELVAGDAAQYGLVQRVLDIGTGPGQLLFAMRKTLPDAELVGIDVSHAMAVQAQDVMKTHGQDPRIHLWTADANALPFADETFDLVVSTGSLHHWKEPLRAFSEVHRVLNANGCALMYDLVREMPKGICSEVRKQFGSFRLALLWIHSFEEPFLNTEEMEALGRQTDFTVEGTKFTGALCCLVLRKTASGMV